MQHLFFEYFSGGTMSSKKLITIIAAGLLLFGFSANAYAELFSVSAGLPVMQSFSSEWEVGSEKESVESDGITGAMVHVKFPIMIGLGYETYVSNLKSFDSGANKVEDITLTTQMVDVFWLTPIPIVNFTVGAGAGTTTLDCDISNGTSCSDFWETGGAGSTYQWYAQLGFPFFPFLDAHVSYHNVSATVSGKDDTDDATFKSNVYAIGIAFIF